MEHYLVGQIVKKHSEYLKNNKVQCYRNRVLPTDFKFCDACRQDFEGPMYSCRWGCSRITCYRCASIGVYHFRCECQIAYTRRIGMDNQEKEFFFDHPNLHRLRNILEKVSRQWWVYRDFEDWYNKDGIKDVEFFFIHNQIKNKRK
jgi:hypothetical protein